MDDPKMTDKRNWRMAECLCRMAECLRQIVMFMLNDSVFMSNDWVFTVTQPFCCKRTQSFYFSELSHFCYICSVIFIICYNGYVILWSC
jgi:hypothetical protein